MTVHFLHPSGTHLTFDPETETWTEEFPKRTWWTPRRIGIATVAYSFCLALLLGYWWGAS